MSYRLYSMVGISAWPKGGLGGGGLGGLGLGGGLGGGRLAGTTFVLGTAVGAPMYMGHPLPSDIRGWPL